MWWLFLDSLGWALVPFSQLSLIWCHDPEYGQVSICMFIFLLTVALLLQVVPRLVYPNILKDRAKVLEIRVISAYIAAHKKLNGEKLASVRELLKMSFPGTNRSSVRFSLDIQGDAALLQTCERLVERAEELLL